MKSEKTTSIIVGVLFLVAMAASLIGGGLVESVMTTPDYLATLSAQKAQLIAGVLLELVNALAVLGIGVLMFPILSLQSRGMARGYLGFRTIEAVFCSAIVIGPLAVLYLSEHPLQAGAASPEYVNAAGALAMAMRASIVSLLIPVFFSLGALLFYWSLYRGALLPRFVTIWGLIAVVLVLVLNLVQLGIELNLMVALVLALPIILNEIFMGIWLIIRGFNQVASTPQGGRQS